MEENQIGSIIIISIVGVVVLGFLIYILRWLIPSSFDSIKDLFNSANNKTREKKQFKKFLSECKERYGSFLAEMNADFINYDAKERKKIISVTEKLIKILTNNIIINGNLTKKDLIIKKYSVVSKKDYSSIENLELKKRFEYSYEILKEYSKIKKLNKCLFFFQIFNESLYLFLKAFNLYGPPQNSIEMLNDVKKWMLNDKYIDFCPFTDYKLNYRSINDILNKCEIKINSLIEEEKKRKETNNSEAYKNETEKKSFGDKIKDGVLTGLGYAVLGAINIMDKMTEDSPNNSSEEYELRVDSLGNKYVSDKFGNRITTVSHTNYDGSITGTDGKTYTEKK